MSFILNFQMFFNIFITMDKKIKNLIDKNVFNSNLLDYDIEEMVTYGVGVVYITIHVDHFKLWRSSGYFDPKYYQLIVSLDDGYFQESLEEFLPIFGFSFEDIQFIYKPKVNTKGDRYSAYNKLFKALNDLVYHFDYTFYPGSPWLNVDVVVLSEIQFYDISEILEEEYDIDTDDIVMLEQ